MTFIEKLSLEKAREQAIKEYNANPMSFIREMRVSDIAEACSYPHGNVAEYTLETIATSNWDVSRQFRDVAIANRVKALHEKYIQSIVATAIERVAKEDTELTETNKIAQ